MIDASTLLSGRSDQAPIGSICWISGYEIPTLTLDVGMIDGHQNVFAMDLGGDGLGDISSLSDQSNTPSLTLASFRLLVDPASAEALLSLHEKKGHAFVCDGEFGLIGEMYRLRGQGPWAFNLSGARKALNFEARGFSFAKWQIVSGEGDERIVIAKRDA